MKYFLIAMMMVVNMTSKASEEIPDITILGDSVFALTNVLADHLTAELGPHNMLAVTGAKLAFIEQQWDKFEHKAETGLIILTGGGNDIFRGYRRECIFQTKKCFEKIDSLGVELEAFVKRLHAESGAHIVYLGLYYFRKFNKPLNPSVDYGMDKMKAFCDELSYCTFVDPRLALTGETPYLMFDDIHANKYGSEVLGKLIVESLMR